MKVNNALLGLTFLVILGLFYAMPMLASPKEQVIEPVDTTQSCQIHHPVAQACDPSLQTASKKQTECPVMGYPINKKYYVDHDGKRVYFCCPGCIKEFKSNPKKYLDRMKKQGVELEDAASEIISA